MEKRGVTHAASYTNAVFGFEWCFLLLFLLGICFLPVSSQSIDPESQRWVEGGISFFLMSQVLFAGQVADA